MLLYIDMFALGIAACGVAICVALLVTAIADLRRNIKNKKFNNNK